MKIHLDTLLWSSGPPGHHAKAFTHSITNHWTIEHSKSTYQMFWEVGWTWGHPCRHWENMSNFRMALNGRPRRVISQVNVKFSVEEPLALTTQQSFEGSSTQAALVHSRHNLVNISAVYVEFYNCWDGPYLHKIKVSQPVANALSPVYLVVYLTEYSLSLFRSLSLLQVLELLKGKQDPKLWSSSHLKNINTKWK